MLRELRSNVIVTASQFNPSIVSQLWLVRKGIVAEEDFLVKDSIFTEDVVQAATKRFTLSVLQPQLQFFPRVSEDKWASQSHETVLRFVQALPETPYTGIGLNFVANLLPSDKAVTELERRLFFNASSPLAEEFASADCHFGAYYSKDMLDGRFRLEIKPAVAHTINGPELRLQASFNFHRDLQHTNAIDAIDAHLKNFVSALNYSNHIIDKVLR